MPPAPPPPPATPDCLTPFDRVIVLDWSAASVPRRGADSIWIGEAGADPRPPQNPATRAEAARLLTGRIAAALAAGQRLLLGADFPFGYPAGFAQALTGQAGALAVWDWLAAHVQDGPDNANNRFALAGAINARLPGTGPFWGCPVRIRVPHLPARGRDCRGHGLPDRRLVETLEPRAQPVWKLYTTGSVGSQAILGIPVLARLRAAFAGQIAVWPFEPPTAPVVLAEVWPTLIAGPVARAQARYPCKDAAQVDLLAQALLGALAGGAAALFDPPAPPGVLAEEGWILGAGQGAQLAAALDRPGR